MGDCHTCRSLHTTRFPSGPPVPWPGARARARVDFLGRSRAHRPHLEDWAMTVATHRTFCRFCHAACPIEVQVETAPAVSSAWCRSVGTVRTRSSASTPASRAATWATSTTTTPAAHRAAAPARRHLRGDPHRAGPRRDRGAPAAGDRRARAPVRRQLQRHGHVPERPAAHPVIRAFHKAIGSPSVYTSITIDQPAKLVTPLRLGSWGAGLQRWSTADVSLVVGST